ncbi:hypothetical protein CFE70_002824 [Pyrenophora teres f. teres 0-1]|nr:hypothetical protein PTTW11_03018 [Pyrenophora teres f. teres]
MSKILPEEFTADKHSMRIGSEGHIVCGTTSGQGSPFTTRFDQTASDTDHSGPFDTVTLSPPVNDSLMLRRTGSGLDVEEATRRGLAIDSAPTTPTWTTHANEEHTRGALLVPSHAPVQHAPPTSQPSTPLPADTRIPHGPANQPATSKLIKTFPSSIRSRVRSFTDAEPLAFRWTFPAHKRYRVKDEEAFAALREKNIEWYVTTGLLKEDALGLKWAAGDYTYLLYWHHDWMPTPDGVDSTCRSLHIGTEFIRDWQVGNWEADCATVVVQDRPATPIVEQPDPIIAPLFRLEQVTSLTNNPSIAGTLPLRPRSALSKRKVPLPPSSDSDSGSSVGGKRVRLHREKRHRILEFAVDDSGVPVEEEGKVVETKVDETIVLTDNEGKTVKSRLGP